jgi:hypothetical protein
MLDAIPTNSFQTTSYLRQPITKAAEYLPFQLNGDYSMVVLTACKHLMLEESDTRPLQARGIHVDEGGSNHKHPQVAPS